METQATKFLKQQKITFEGHPYEYEHRGGTKVSARELGVSEHQVIKTLIMQNESKEPLVILMHGDCQVSTKELARQIGAKKVEPCTPESASRHTGYLVGGTSPFGTKRKMPIFMEKSIADLPLIYINGGRRGYLVSIDPADMMQVLKITLVNVALSVSE